MRFALGIDAAWTATQPSGVALAAETPGGWRLVAVESSYARFRQRADGLTPLNPPAGEAPDVGALLAACERLGGRPALVAVDMPLSLAPIVGRRASDLAVSRAFGAAKAATHSPSALRPGRLADKMRADFQEAGYRLWTAAERGAPGLMEVYPHAALLRLSGDRTRFEYKAGKTTTYWPGVALGERRLRVRDVWRRIVGLLDREMAGVAEALPPPEPQVVGRALKAFEDRLDAVVCAYVAVAALRDEVEGFGDEASAVWIPIAQSNSN